MNKECKGYKNGKIRNLRDHRSSMPLLEGIFTQYLETFFCGRFLIFFWRVYRKKIWTD